MKFCTLALAAALLAPKVNSQITMTNGNFTFIGSYESTALGAYLGGGSIVGNKLLIVVEAEYASSKIASVPILRNGKLFKTCVFIMTIDSSLIMAMHTSNKNCTFTLPTQKPQEGSLGLTSQVLVTFTSSHIWNRYPKWPSL